MLRGAAAFFALALSIPASAAQPDTELEQSVRNIAEHFLSDQDEGRFEYAYAWLSEDYQARVSLTDFTAELAKFNASAGPVRSRVITRVIFEPLAANAGTTAALEVISAFARIEHLCTVVTLHRPVDGTAFRVRPPGAADERKGLCARPP